MYSRRKIACTIVSQRPAMPPERLYRHSISALMPLWPMKRSSSHQPSSPRGASDDCRLEIREWSRRASGCSCDSSTPGSIEERSPSQAREGSTKLQRVHGA